MTDLKVDHNAVEFTEGQEYILTLKDSNILEDGEIIENEDLMENTQLMEQWKRESAKRKNDKAKNGNQSIGYQDFQVGKSRKILDKYDEDEEEKEGFILGEKVKLTVEETALKDKNLVSLDVNKVL